MITDHNRDEIKKLVKDGICTPEALRDYDLLKEISEGKTILEAAKNHNVSYTHAKRIKAKYTAGDPRYKR